MRLGKDRRRVAEAIRTHGTFLVGSHVRPGGDAIGSVLAMGHLLGHFEKQYTLLNEDPVPPAFSFLPGSADIRPPGPDVRQPEVALVLDCGCFDRTGSAEVLLAAAEIVINIDHHASNDLFGQINLVDPTAAAAGEIVLGLFDEMDVPPGLAASALYTSILTDTGSFRQSNTTARTHEMAARLLEEGVRPEDISERVLEAATVGARRLLGAALSGIEQGCAGRVAWLQVTREMLKATGCSMEDTEKFVDFARYIPGVEVALLFRELEGGEVGVSFRSRGSADVNSIAASWGGGGHRLASGCRIRGQLKAVRAEVIARVSGALDRLPGETRA